MGQTLGLVAAVLITMAGCGNASTATVSASPSESRDPEPSNANKADEALRRVSRRYTTHCGPGPLPLSERLPNTTVVSYGQEFSASDVAIRGDVVRVEAGSGFRPPPADSPADERTDFDDKRSTWKTIHLTVRVIETLAGDAPDEVRVGFTIEPGTSLDEAQQLLAVDDAVFLLGRDHPFYDYDRSLLGSNPDVIATVAADGHLSLPVLDDADEQRLLAGTPDVAALTEAARRPQQRLERDIPGCA